jgi:hypothetical protein
VISEGPIAVFGIRYHIQYKKGTVQNEAKPVSDIGGGEQSDEKNE